MALALVLTLLSPTTYEATSRLFVAVTPEAAQSPNQGNLLASADFLKSQVQSFAELATSPEVLGRSAARTAASIPASAVKASSPTGTFLIDVTGSGPSGRSAAARANFVAARMRSYVPSVATKLPDGRPAFILTVAKPAVAPASPSSPRWAVNLILGLVLGLVAGVTFVLVRGEIDSRRRESGPQAAAAEPEDGSIADDASS